MSLEDLYRDVILDHYRHPRHHHQLDQPDATEKGVNPLCGDEIVLELDLDGDRISRVAVLGQGCSISQASGSMMAIAIVDKPISEVRDIIGRFKRMLGIADGPDPIDPDRPGAALGDLEALAGVRKFPVRIKCADLAWATLEQALDSKGGSA